MLKLKKYFILTGAVIIINIIISLFYFFTNVSYNTISSILMISYLISFAIIGFLTANKNNSKGIIIGLKTSSIIIILLFLLTLLLKLNFNVKNIIYYLLVMLSTIFGSVISKNIKN